MVKAVTPITHHFAGLADIAELSGKLQQSHLGADDLPFLGHRRCPLETPRPGATNSDHSAPRLGFRLSHDTNCLKSSLGKHESFEKRGHFRIRIKGKNMRYILVCAHNSHTASF